MILRIRETIGRLLYLLHRWGWWRAPGYWLAADWRRHYGYGRLDDEFQFPVRELERRK